MQIGYSTKNRKIRKNIQIKIKEVNYHFLYQMVVNQKQNNNKLDDNLIIFGYEFAKSKIPVSFCQILNLN